MSTEGSYSIDGKLCSGLEYLELVDRVFKRESIDTSYIELPNGEGVSLGGCSACVSVLHHRNDGTTWTPKEEITKESVRDLIRAFIENDVETLSAHGAIAVSPKERKRVDLLESGKVHRVLSRLFLCLLGVALVITIVWALAGGPGILWALAFLFYSLALVIIIFAGIGYMLDACRYISNTVTTCSRYKQAGAYILLAFGVLFMFIFSVILPLYLIILMVWKITTVLI